MFFLQDIIHASDCDIKFSLKGIKAKITDFSLRGMIRVVLKVNWCPDRRFGREASPYIVLPPYKVCPLSLILSLLLFLSLTLSLSLSYSLFHSLSYRCLTHDTSDECPWCSISTIDIMRVPSLLLQLVPSLRREYTYCYSLSTLLWHDYLHFGVSTPQISIVFRRLSQCAGGNCQLHGTFLITRQKYKTVKKRLYIQNKLSFSLKSIW